MNKKLSVGYSVLGIGYWVFLGSGAPALIRRFWNSPKNARQKTCAALTQYPIPNTRPNTGYLLPLALAFAWMCFAALVMQTRQTNLLAAPAVLSVAAIAAEAFLRRVAPSRDPLLWPSAVLLMAFGLIVIARVAPNFLPRQMLWVCLGAGGMCAVAPARFGLRWLRRFKYTWLLIGLALLAATLFFNPPRCCACL
jgi:hypothetical protein